MLNATRFADEPELTVIRCLTPRNLARRASNLSLKWPVVSQQSREASTISSISFAPTTLPAGGTTVLPGSNGTGWLASAPYWDTSWMICSLS